MHVKEFDDLRIYRQDGQDFDTICTDLKGLQSFLQKLLFVSDKLGSPPHSEQLTAEQRKNLQEMLDYFSDHSETLKLYGE